MNTNFTITLTAEELKMICVALQNREDILDNRGKHEDAEKCSELNSKLTALRY